MRFFLSILLSAFILGACQQNTSPKSTNNSPAFKVEADGDSATIALAKEVMEASGGIDSWQNIPVITWNFFGRRKLLWDKHNKLVRIDLVEKSIKMWVDLNSDTVGQVWMNDHYLSGDSLQLFLQKTKSIWINDSYWLCFPFKLLDKGVTLSELSKDTTMLGEQTQTFWMTFDAVGDTPQNRYKVYVSDLSKRIVQWDFYRDSNSVVSDLSTTFETYNEFGGVLLSQKRSGFELSDIQVFETFSSDSLKDLSLDASW